MSSLHNIWLVFQWSKPMCRYESNADEIIFSQVNQWASGGEEGLLVRERRDRERELNRWSKWHQEDALWFSEGESKYKTAASNRFGFKTYLCRLTGSLSCSRVSEGEIKTGISSPPECLVSDKPLRKILTRWLHHTLSQTGKQGVQWWQQKAAEGSTKHRKRHNARAGSPSASRRLSEIKEDVSSSLTRA